MKPIRMLTVVGLAAFLFVGTAGADTYIKSVTETEAMEIAGQQRPAMTDTMEVWMSSQRAVTILGGGQKFIVDAEDQTLTLVRPDRQAYTQIPAGDLGVMLDSAAAAAIDSLEAHEEDEIADTLRQRLGQIMGNITYEVTATDSTKQIDQWQARKYVVTMNMGMGATVTSEVWATDEVDIDWGMYRAMMLRTMAFMPNAEELWEESQKLEGLTVRANVTTEMMGMEMTAVQRLLEVDTDREPPAGVYEVPEGYEKVNDPMMIMGQ